MASLVENTVRTLAPSWLVMRRSTSGLRSMTVTVAPIPGADQGRIGAGHAAAEDDHIGGRHPGYAPEQHAAAAVLLLQATGADMRRHAARNLRHRGQQRQGALRARHRLIGDRDDARGDQIRGLLRVGGQMQIGEEDLPGTEFLALTRERLLDFDHQLAARVNLIGIGDDFGPDRTVIGVGNPGAQSGARFNDDMVPVPRQLAHRRRHEPTRYSLSLISFGTPMSIVAFPLPPALRSGQPNSRIRSLRLNSIIAGTEH